MTSRLLAQLSNQRRFVGAFLATSIRYLADGWNIATCFFHGPSPAVSVAMTVFIGFGWALPVITILYSNSILFKAVIRANTQITAQVNSIGGHSGTIKNNPSVTLHKIRSGKNVLVICLAVLVLTIPVASVVVVIAV